MGISPVPCRCRPADRARREGLLKALRGKYSHRMFWLTTEAAYRENIGGAIFKTPKDDATIPFFFLTV
jgi:hypothetical protein